MTDVGDDEWISRDRPVLLAAARLLKTEKHLSHHNVMSQLDLSKDDAIEALMALSEAGYLDTRPLPGDGGIMSVHINGITERGRREIGLWPSDDPVQALMQALAQAEQETKDPEEKGKIRRAADALGAVSRDVLVGVLSAMTTRQIGGG